MRGETKSEGDQVARFGPFELDATRRVVFRNGIRLKLQQQPFSVLELLIQRAPDIVLREEIRRRIWGDDVHVDAEQGIAFCIRQIRSVLGDDSTAPRYIETIPRQGFRFVGSLETVPETTVLDEFVSSTPPAMPSEERASDAPAPHPPSGRKVSRWVIFGVIAGALLAAIGAIAFRLVRHNDLYTVAAVNLLTTYPGAALHPCYSPDGRQVTFSWDGEGERSIYVALPQSDHRVRLTHGSVNDDYPMWSPDGKYIAFFRLSSAYAGELMLIPSVGGEERTLRAVDLSLDTISTSSLLAWTPDSKWICITTRLEKSKSRAGLVMVSPETGESHPVFPTPDRNTSDSSPAFSPDGHWLAFTRFSSFFLTTIVLQPLSDGFHPDGNPIAVRGGGTNPRSPVWTEDSRSLFFLDRETSRVLQAVVSDVTSMRPAHLIYAADTQLEGLNLAGPEPRLCTSRVLDVTGLWTLSLKGDSTGARVPQRILESKANQYHPEFSPDGASLAFVSARNGSAQVWVSSAKGEHPRQLTHLASYILGYPSWSPDGALIAFHARVPDTAEQFAIPAAGGVLQQVTKGLPSIGAPSWSNDGKFLYGFGPNSGSQFLFRVTLTSGKRELLWEGTNPRQVPGRHLLLYDKLNQRGLFARLLTDRGMAEPEQKLVTDFTFLGGRGFVPFRDGFYYVATDQVGRPRAFCFYSFDSKRTVDLAPAPQDVANGLAVSPDRNTLVYGAFRSDEAELISLELKKESRW